MSVALARGGDHVLHHKVSPLLLSVAHRLLLLRGALAARCGRHMLAEVGQRTTLLISVAIIFISCG